MKIFVGTTNPAKISAIEEGVKKCPYFQNEKVEIVGEKVSSGVSDMPLSLEENILGAENRARNLREKFDGDFYLGLEGGTTRIGEKAYLFGAVFILDKNGKGHLGLSNFMEVPEEFDRRIYENGEELGTVLSDLTGVENTSKKNGAFGAWSDDMLTRKDQFVLAFLSAIVPFFNKYYKKN